MYAKHGLVAENADLHLTTLWTGEISESGSL